MKLKLLPDDALDHHASALRARLSRNASYPERTRDAAALREVETELQTRAAANQALEKYSHGGVFVCKRPADLPVVGTLGLEHWWIQTAHKSIGMGQADGTVPGHGESGPPNRDTALIDHRNEVPIHCDPQPGVDEECVDRELQIGKDAGKWTPPFNDCHTVVTSILERCRTSTLDDVLARQVDEDRRQQDGGAP